MYNKNRDKEKWNHIGIRTHIYRKTRTNIRKHRDKSTDTHIYKLNWNRLGHMKKHTTKQTKQTESNANKDTYINQQKQKHKHK